MYNAKFLDLFNQVSNYGLLRGANASGMSQNEKTNEVVKIYMKIENNMIVDAKFKACGSIKTIVLAENLTTNIKNMSLSDVEALIPSQIVLPFEEFGLNMKPSQDVVFSALVMTLADYEEQLRKEKIRQLKLEGKEIPEELKKSKK